MFPYSDRRQGTIRKGGSPYNSASLHICEHNGQLIATFKDINNMKYAKIENDQLLVKEVEKGQEVGGKLTEEEIIAQGYKPYCEMEKPEGADFFINREYETCIVQEWGTITEEHGISREALLFFIENTDSNSVITLTLPAKDYVSIIEDEEIQSALKNKPSISIVTL